MCPINEELEYRERWEYIKHSEVVRYRAAGWYFTVVGVLLTAAYTGKLEFVNLYVARSAVLVFLVLYSLATIIYLNSLKLSYREHVDRVRNLDCVGTEERDEGFGAFSFYIYSLGLVAAGLAFAAVVEISRPEAQEELGALSGVCWGVVAAILVFGFVLFYNVCRLRTGDGYSGLDECREDANSEA